MALAGIIIVTWFTGQLPSMFRYGVEFLDRWAS